MFTVIQLLTSAYNGESVHPLLQDLLQWQQGGWISKIAHAYREANRSWICWLIELSLWILIFYQKPLFALRLQVFC